MPVKRSPARSEPTETGFSALVASIREVHLACAAQASRAVNVSLTLRNWLIGAHIHHYELQGADRASYGDRLLAELSEALRGQQVSNSGKRQLYGYLAFYRTYPQIVQTASAQSAPVLAPAQLEEKVRTVSALLPEGLATDPDLLINRLSYSHFEQLVDLDDPLQRVFYEIEALRGNWSVRELKRQVGTLYYQRSGLSIDKAALSRRAHAAAEQGAPQQVIRDPYVFEFLGLKSQEVVTEGQLEDALLDKLQAFLLELGHGFCFEARQKRLLIGSEHFFVDLVFYHRVLKCHVLIELKNDAFRHEHLGQLNSYVGYYKEHEMSDGDQPPIGILLCTRKNVELVKYALAGMSNQLFVSRYQVQLPGKDEIAAFLHKAVAELAGGGK